MFFKHKRAIARAVREDAAAGDSLRRRDPLRSLQRAGDERAAAAMLCDELDRAIERGQWERAHRLAESATRLWPRYRKLAEPMARLRLAHGDATTALMIIEGVPLRTASMRLLRAVCLLHEGRRDEAHGELVLWTRRSSAPIAARRLRAILEWSIGDRESARQCLRQNLRQLEDADSIELLLLLAAFERRADVASQWAQRLTAAPRAARDDAIHQATLLMTMGIRCAEAHATNDDGRARQLAMELLAQESILPALVEAQCAEPDAATIELLIAALEIALPEMRNVRIARESLRVLGRVRERMNQAAALDAARLPVEAGGEDVIAVIRSDEESHTIPATRRKAA